MEHTILVVEDEQGIREAIGIYMKNQGYNVILAANGKEGLEKIETNDIHLAIVDIMMPVMDGISMVMEARKHHDFPILFLSAKSEDIDKITGLNIGADDYISKPYNAQVLLARIQKLLARTYEIQDNVVLTHKGLTLNLLKAEISYQGQRKSLTKNEMTIFMYLLSHREHIVSRDELMTELWNNEEYLNDNALTVNISRLRGRFKDIGLEDVIETRKGQGYILV